MINAKQKYMAYTPVGQPNAIMNYMCTSYNLPTKLYFIKKLQSIQLPYTKT